MTLSPATIASDWSYPRNAHAFTGYIKTDPYKSGPQGTLLLCVANTPIPCKPDAVHKFIQLTVINVREKGWVFAPWKKPASKGVKVTRDENAKDLFVMKDWARNDVTMERVGQSVLAYAFNKDGQSKGERVDDLSSLIASGQTYKFRLHDFMFEEKKNMPQVFPQDIDVIPAFSVVEVMISPSNSKQYEEGWGIGISQVRPCGFSLYSMQQPLGLGLLSPTYEDSVHQAEGHIQGNSGLRKVLEDKNTGFFGKVVKGSYFINYNSDYRLVGPKEDPNDQQSRHRNVMDGGVFAIDISKEELLRFTNSGESEEEDGLVHATFLVELAAAGGALDCYVTYNEYLLRHDPNRSPFTGVPLIDSQRLLEFIRTEEISVEFGQRFPLPFDFFPMDRPYLELAPVPEDLERPGGNTVVCSDFSLASENTCVGGGRSYKLTLGDATEEDIRSFLFIPKMGSSGARLQGRQDYRMHKKRKNPEAGQE